MILASFLTEELEDMPIEPRLELLTAREKEILQLISNGDSSKIIAAQLNISEETVTTHRKNLIQKFNVKNSAELIKMAMRYHQIN
jgi:DNA-binding CsgD family transcriptional regulator